jgi:hypothetical protein
MTVASEIAKLQSNLGDCYTAVDNKGGTMPVNENFDNLATAIGSIPSGVAPSGTINISSNGTYDVTNYASAVVTASGGYADIPSYEIANGVVTRGSLTLSSTTFSNITEIAADGWNNNFNRCNVTGALNLSALTTVGSGGLAYTFYKCSGITSLNLSSLTTLVGGNNQAFYGCSGMTNVDLSSLTTVGQDGLRSAFHGCTGLTSVSFPSLTSIGSAGFYEVFGYCTALTDVYFYALTTTSFGTYTNQFVNFFFSSGTGVTHTIHFPSNLESKIQSLNGYPNFGGSSGYVTLAFDLPATS